MIKTKKGQAQQGVWGLLGLILALTITGIIIGIVVYVLFTLNSAAGGDTVANTTKNVSQALLPAINAIMSIPGWMALIVTVAVAALVIGLVMAAFAFIRMRE
jgi:hypothetical protein